MKYLEQFSDKPQNTFSWLFWNFLFGYLPVGLLIAILSLVGIIPFMINDKPHYGFIGFIFLLIYVPVAAFILSIVTWVFLSMGNAFLKLFNKLF